MIGYLIFALLLGCGLIAFIIWVVISADRAHRATLEPEEEEQQEQPQQKRIEQAPSQEPYKITAPAVLAWYFTGGYLADVASPLHNLPAAKSVMSLALQQRALPKERVGPGYLALPSPKVQRAIDARNQQREAYKEEEVLEEEDEPLDEYYNEEEEEEEVQQPKATGKITSLVRLVKEGREAEFRVAFIEVMRRIYARSKDYPSITQTNYMYNGEKHSKELAELLLPRSLWNELLSGEGMLRTLGFLVSQDGETRLPKEEEETRLQGATIGTVSSWFNLNYDKIIEFAKNYK